jgi:hypothetical protein
LNINNLSPSSVSQLYAFVGFVTEQHSTNTRQLAYISVSNALHAFLVWHSPSTAKS